MRRYNGISRRGFLRSTVLTGTGIYTSSIFDGMVACEGMNRQGPSTLDCKINAVIGIRRTLESGTASMVVSAMGFDCMGLNHHRGQHPGKKQVITLVHEAIDCSVILFDAAENYGYQTNEQLVGEALKDYSDRVSVTTKFGYKFVGGVQTKTEEGSSPNNIRRVCESSLRNLGVETLGMFYQRRADPNTPIEVVAGTVNGLIKESKILHFGLYEVSADTIHRAHRVCPVTAIQSEYHLMHRVMEGSVLLLYEKLGIGFVPYSPINRDFLGSLINEYTRFDPENDNRQDLPCFQPEATRASMRIVEVLDAFGGTQGVTPAQVTLAWLMSKKPWIVAIPGTTKLSHLEESLRTADVILTTGEMRELENAVSAIPVVGSRYNALQESKVQK